MKFIKAIDILSQEMKLLTEGSSARNKNYIGGTISMLAGAVIISAVVYFLRIFFSREKSTIITNIVTDRNVSIPNYDEIPFMVRITDGLKNIVEDQTKLFEIVGSRWWMVTNETDPQKRKVFDWEWLKFEYCSLDKINEKYRYLFENDTDLTSFLCPQYKMPAAITGLFGDPEYFELTLWYIRPCLALNVTTPFDVYGKGTRDDCYDSTYINDYLTAAFLEYRTIEYSIQNFEIDPKKLVVYSQRTPLSNTVWKRIWLHYQTIVYNSDFGYIFSELSTTTFFQIEKVTTDLDLRNVYLDEVTNAFVWISSINSNKKIYYYRSYMKAQELLANMGGITKGILIIGIILNYFISKKYGNLNLIENRIEYLVDLCCTPSSTNKIEIKNENIDSVFRKEKSSMQMVSSQPHSNINLENNKNKSNVYSANNLLINEAILKDKKFKKKLSLSFMQIICPLCCFKNSSNAKTYQKGKDIIQREMNVLVVLKNMSQIEKLKEFVLSEEQLILFNYVYENPKFMNNYSYSSVISSYFKLCQQPSRTENDEKVLDLFNKLMKSKII